MLPGAAQKLSAHPEIAFRFRHGSYLAYSPDGKLVATGGQDLTIQLWDSRNGELLRSLPLPEPAVSLAFSPDGALLASVSEEGTVRLWNMATHTSIPPRK